MSEMGIKTAEPILLYDEYQDIHWIPAPCQKACPVGTDAPSYIGLIWEERFEEALEVITATNPFSSVCGRVCAKLCETSCRRGESDAPVSVRNLKRFIMDRLGPGYRPSPVEVSREKSVGIVGAGPTGLTAAQDLAELGYEVHIYEKSNLPGGMMNVIPEFRLPREKVEEDIQRILQHCPGITLHLNTSLGDHVSIEDLKEKHDAVLLAVGLWKDRELGIPGARDGLSGIYGINFLTDLHNGMDTKLEGRTIVVGGGNVAVDMARTALRTGAREVRLFCLETREEMPAWDHEIEECIREGIDINTSWGPNRILRKNNKVTGVEFMRCLSVFDDNGGFSPVYNPDQTLTVDAESVILAIGLTVDGEDLDTPGIIEKGGVAARFETMQTSDLKVFAAGDCAFGPSAIVTAMSHGHRAAYYMHAYLEGREKPVPYSVPFRTRMVPVAQDPDWEKLPREEQTFLGVGHGETPFAECEATYGPETAKRQAARCLRCDAETGSANYPRRSRELIHAMARTEPGNTDRLREIQLHLLQPRRNPFPPDRPAHIDDLVFLSAALTRLVIDPYRESCSTETILGSSLELRQPLCITGFDNAPEEIQSALALGLASSGCGYIGKKRLSAKASSSIHERDTIQYPWLQLIEHETDIPLPDADALIYVMGNTFQPIPMVRLHEKQLLGLSASASSLPRAVPFALENNIDLLILDGTKGIQTPWVELKGHPDLTVMRDTIRILRELNREEEISLLYFGGIRSGTDIAKVLAINCNAAAVGTAMGIALGGTIEDGTISFTSNLTLEERVQAAENWIKATAEETAIIARCTGKTNVHNLEPEDMRSITLAVSEAMDIPMASGGGPRERF